MKRLAALFLTLSILCTAFAGCSSSGNKETEESQGAVQTEEPSAEMPIEDFAKVVSAYEETFVPMDNDIYIYLQGLDSAKKYLDGEMSGTDAFEFIYNTMTDMQYDKAEIEEKTVDEELEELLIQLGISPEEFEMFLNYREYNLNSYIDSLYYLASNVYYVDMQLLDKENLEFLLSLYRLMNDCNEGNSFYINLNYWFAQCSEQQLDYLFEELGTKLKCYDLDSGSYVWENDRDLAEAKSDIYLDIWDECVDIYSEYSAMTDDGGDDLEMLFIKLSAIQDKFPKN